MGCVIWVNGRLSRPIFVELLGGLRIRFGIDDWNLLDLFRGQRVPVKMAGKDEVCLYITDVVETPPVAWAVLVERFKP